MEWTKNDVNNEEETKITAGKLRDAPKERRNGAKPKVKNERRDAERMKGTSFNHLIINQKSVEDTKNTWKKS